MTRTLILSYHQVSLVLSLHIIVIEIPHYDKTEVASKQFVKKFNKFTNEKYHIRLKCLPGKMKTLFKLKYLCIYPSSKIYKGICICGETYTRETIGNVETKWEEHNPPSEKSNPSKLINSHCDIVIFWHGQ